MATLLTLHGPNLNLLGNREPEVYGSTTLGEVNDNLTKLALKAGHTMLCAQSNAEHELVEHIQLARGNGIEFILINAAAFTHTSISIRDALAASHIPFIEVHISNIFRRESFRHYSYLSDLAQGMVCGLGVYGYELALLAAIEFLRKR